MFLDDSSNTFNIKGSFFSIKKHVGKKHLFPHYMERTHKTVPGDLLFGGMQEKEG